MSSILQSENTTQRRLLVHLKHLLPTSNCTNNQLEQCDSTNLNELIEPNVVRGLYTYNDESDRYSSISYNYKHTFDVKKMTLFLSPTFDKKEMFKFLDKPLMLTKNINITKEEAREIALKQVIFLCQSGYFNITDLKKNPELFLQRLEAGIIDASMNVKLGVQLLLFSGSIMNLGTKKHHDLYLKRAERCELPGAFAMTEIEHGSNVRELKTTATFDEKTNEFVINTPNKGAIKWWLGNAACHGVMATVFARLILKGKDYGVHAFLCPIRDPQTMKLMPGVIAGDCGDKIGLHGVDNGFLEFDNVRIPYDNLLDRFGGIDLESKTYKSEFDSAGRRFAAVLGELITGRVSIVSGSLNCRRVGCMIATRYASQRTQFSAGKEFPEQPILDYKSHKVRLMPIIASSYVFEFIKRNVVKKYSRLHLEKVSDDDLQEIHALSAGLKAVMSWDTQTHIQTLREMCGGHGYSAYNRLGTLRNDHDVLKTFEGDNTVLIQQLGGYLLKEFSKQFTGEMVSDSIQYIRKQVGGIAQRNPVITRFSSKKHLRNSDYHLQAFEYRTAKLLQECALEINVNKKKQGIFRAFGESLPKLVRLGRAYVEQVALHDYLNGIEDVKDVELKRILKLMGDLYALDTISKNVGDFIDIIKKNKLSAVHDMVEWLCEELRVHAVSLVDSFGFPDFLLDAPIAKRDHGNYVHHILNYSLTRNKENAEFVGKMQTDIVPKRKNIASDSNDINQVMEINL